MKKVIDIKGMTCEHCQARVEKALNGIDGVDAKVELKKNRAIVNLKKDVSDQLLTSTVTEAGYEVVGIAEKKGLFS